MSSIRGDASYFSKVTFWDTPKFMHGIDPNKPQLQYRGYPRVHWSMGRTDTEQESRIEVVVALYFSDKRTKNNICIFQTCVTAVNQIESSWPLVRGLSGHCLLSWSIHFMVFDAISDTHGVVQCTCANFKNVTWPSIKWRVKFSIWHSIWTILSMMICSNV